MVLKDCLEVFKKMYGKYGDKLIIDSYTLSEGSYVLVKKDGSLEILEVSKKDTDKTDSLYKYFAQRDYLSRLVTIDKPMDSKKVIHSNNYLTFFIRKDNMKLNDEIIDNYYNIFIDPVVYKYKADKKKRIIYNEIENIYGKSDKEKIEENRNWIKQNISGILKSVKQDKNYMKIFREEEIQLYINESNKYLYPNIYAKNDFSTNIDGITYGLHNNNMGLNSKKPYLQQRGRKNTIPYLINEDEVWLQKK